MLILKSCTGEETLIEFYQRKSLTSVEINAGSFWTTNPTIFKQLGHKQEIFLPAEGRMLTAQEGFTISCDIATLSHPELLMTITRR